MTRRSSRFTSGMLGVFASAAFGALLPAQASRPAADAVVVVDPDLSATGARGDRFAPWVAMIAAAERSLLKEDRPEKARPVFEELLKADRGNPIARHYLARIAVEDGRWEDARRLLGSARKFRRRPPREPVPLTGWQILGPFGNNRRGAGFSTVYEPEKKLDLEASYKGDGRICRWKKVKGPRIDFDDELGIEGPAVGYGYCEFLSKRNGWVRIGVASADGIKIWLNGDLIHDKFDRRSLEEDDDLIHAWVGRGENRILVKLETNGGAFEFYIQVYDELRPAGHEFVDAAISAQQALERRRYDDASERFLAAELLHPGNPEVALGLAESRLRQGNLVAARSWISRALLKRAGSPRCLAIYGEIMMEMGESRKAFDALRAAYRASEFADEAIHELWLKHARARDEKLQEGLALLDEARGALGKDGGREARRETVPPDPVASALPFLEGSFVGLADLSDYYREAGEREKSCEYGCRAVSLLSPDEAALTCSAEWLMALVSDLNRVGGHEKARREILEVVALIDPGRPGLVQELLRLPRNPGAPVASPGIEALLRRRPEKDSYKRYVEALLAAREYDRVVEISREGLEAGIISRKLRYWQAHALLALKRLDESEAVFRGLLEEKDYIDRANRGLALVRKARGE